MSHSQLRSCLIGYEGEVETPTVFFAFLSHREPSEPTRLEATCIAACPWDEDGLRNDTTYVNHDSSVICHVLLTFITKGMWHIGTAHLVLTEEANEYSSLCKNWVLTTYWSQSSCGRNYFNCLNYLLFLGYLWHSCATGIIVSNEEWWWLVEYLLRHDNNSLMLFISGNQGVLWNPKPAIRITINVSQAVKWEMLCGLWDLLLLV